MLQLEKEFQNNYFSKHNIYGSENFKKKRLYTIEIFARILLKVNQFKSVKLQYSILFFFWNL